MEKKVLISKEELAHLKQLESALNEMKNRVEENKQTKQYLEDREKTRNSKHNGLKYKKVPIRVLTVGIPGKKRHVSVVNQQIDPGSSGEETKFAQADENLDYKPKSENYTEGVASDIANIGKLVKKYDKSIYNIVGGPFQFVVGISSGSILDGSVTKEIILDRISKVFDEATEDTIKGVTNTIFLYFTGHGDKNLIYLENDQEFQYADLYDQIRKEIDRAGKDALLKVQIVIEACYSGTAIDMFDPYKNLQRDQLKLFSALAKQREKEIVLKIMTSSKGDQQSYDMREDKGGAFTELAFSTNKENLLYWQKKWFGRVPNPKYTHPSMDQQSMSMDAFFWGDGEIMLHIDDEKVIDSQKVEDIPMQRPGQNNNQ